MPDYQYTAISREGREVKGREHAANRAELEVALKKRRLLLVKASEQGVRTVSLALTTALITELARLLGNGVALDRALQIIAEDTVDEKLSRLAHGLRQNIKRGEALSRGLEQTGRFDPLFITLVRVGEGSGQLAETLNYLESHYQSVQAFRSEIITALAYPMTIALMSLLSLVGLAVYVVPSFRDIFLGQENTLPLGTRWVFAASDWLLANGLWLLLGVVGFVVLTGMAYRASATLQYQWHRLLLGLPVLSGLVTRFEAAKMLKVMGLMLRSGVPLVASMELAGQILSNRVQQAGMARVIQQLRKGVSIPAALEENLPMLPKIAHRFVRLGNETGRLPENCTQAAEILRLDFTLRIKTLVSVLDPLIIVFMGGIVGFIVSSMMLAVFGLSDIK